MSFPPPGSRQALFFTTLGLTVLASFAGGAGAQTGTKFEPPALSDSIQVTTTRVPEDVEALPAFISVISGEELRARGATDLTSALALLGGVAIAPGGDGGPLGAVPEIWGLREFDAFLLVVDGIPWGGAFIPETSTLDLASVERIEVLRGPAPVMYGATAFSGVIQVIRKSPGAVTRRAELGVGSHSSGDAKISLALPKAGSFEQSLSADYLKKGYKDERAEGQRGHVLYRAAGDGWGGKLHFDVDGTFQRQDPDSPVVREGRVLTTKTPLDANHNPADAKIDDDRFRFAAGYDREAAGGTWTTTLSFTHTKRDTVRGFLTSLTNTHDNAVGFEQDLKLDELYLDSHLAWKPQPNVQIVAGFDHTAGKGEADSESFAYTVGLNGRNAESSGGVEHQMAFELEDERNFSGLYTQVDWNPTPRLHIQVGGRLNRTVEEREAGEEELDPDAGEEEEEEEGKDNRTVTRGSGAIGLSFLAWEGEGDGDGLWLFADARDTYKPAVLDFGPEAEPDILKPETARSYEAGIKGQLGRGRLDFEVTTFQMDFKNLVVAQAVNGRPALVNAGQQRFKGYEIETRYHFLSDLLGTLAYSHHDSKFRDYVQDFDGVATQLSGKRLEMVPKELASLGLIYNPSEGVTGWAAYQHVGERFLNKRNTALADSYDTFSAGIGYRFSRYEIRLDGDNLTDERPPVAESELGDAQYYLLPARSFRLGFEVKF